MVFRILPQEGLRITQNGHYPVWKVPAGEVWRPIIISTRKLVDDGVYNIDHLYIQDLDDNVICYLDDGQDKANFYALHLGHLDGWLLPGWDINQWISNFEAPGRMIVRMWVEIRMESKFETFIQDVRVKEQPIKTRPRLWPW